MGDNNNHLRVAPEPPGEPIANFDVPSNVEGIEGTEDSTARTTFPKVSRSLPEYLLVGHVVNESTDVDYDIGLWNLDANSIEY